MDSYTKQTLTDLPITTPAITTDYDLTPQTHHDFDKDNEIVKIEDSTSSPQQEKIVLSQELFSDIKRCELIAFERICPTSPTIPQILIWWNDIVQRAGVSPVYIAQRDTSKPIHQTWCVRVEVDGYKLPSFWGQTKHESQANSILAWYQTLRAKSRLSRPKSDVLKCVEVQTLSSDAEPNIATLGANTMAREPERVQDSTILDLTNPQSSSIPVIPVAATVWRGMSASLPDHEFETLTGREFFFGRFDLQSSDKVDTTNLDIKLPSDLFHVEGLVNILPYLTHATNSTEMEFIFKVNPPPNQAGLYVFTVIPNPDPIHERNLDVWTHPTTIFLRDGLGAPALNLGTQNDARIDVAFNMPVSFIMSNKVEDTLSSMRNSARLYCKCVSPLSTGDSDLQTLSVSVWAKIKKTGLNSLRYQVTPDETIRSMSNVQTLSGKKEIDGVMTSLWSGIKALPGVGPLAGTIGKVVGNFGVALIGVVDSEHVDEVEDRLGNIGLIARPRSNQRSTTQNVPSVHSHVTSSQAEVRVAPAATAPLSNANLSNMSRRLATHNNSQVIPLEASDMMSISARLNRPCLLRAVKISTSTPVGTKLISLSMGLTNDQTLFHEAPAHSFFAGEIPLLGSCFQFYAGVKIYTFLIVKTAFHKLSLTCAGSPLIGVPNAVEAGSQYLKVIDFNDRNDAEYSCPYVDKFPCRDISGATPHIGPVRYGVKPVAGQQYFDTAVSNPGELAIFLNTPLVITGNATDPLCADTVELLIFERMADGASLMCPTDPRCELYFEPTTQPPLIEDMLQTLSGPPDSEIVTEDNQGDFGLVTSIVNVLGSSESTDDIRLLVNRFTAFRRLPPSIYSYYLPLTPRTFSKFSGPFSSAEDTNVPTWSWALTHCYRYYNGSFDFLIRAPQNNLTQVFFVPNQGLVGEGHLGVGNNEFNSITRGSVTYNYPWIANGSMTDIIEPIVNPWLTVSTAKYSKPTKVDIWVDLTPTNQLAHPEDARIASNGNLVFSTLMPIDTTTQHLFVYPKWGADVQFSTYMGPMPMKYDSNVVAPTYRKFVSEQSSIPATRVNANALAKLAMEASEKVHLELVEDPIWPTKYPRRILKSEPVIAPEAFVVKREKLRKQFKRQDDNLELLKAGVEKNPGPVVQMVPPPSPQSPSVDEEVPTSNLGFRARMSRAVASVSQHAFSPITSRLDVANAHISTTAKDVSEATRSISTTANSMTTMLESVNATATQIFDSIKGVVGALPNMNQLFNAILHFVHVWISPTVATIGVAIAGILSSLGLVPFEMITNLSQKLGHLIGLHWGSPSNEVPSDGESNVQTLAGPPTPTEDEWHSFGALIFSSVCSFVGVSLTAKSVNISQLMGGFFKSLPQTWTMTTHVTKFLKDTISYFQKCFDWIKGTDPTLQAVENIFENKEMIPRFVEEAQLMLSALNEQAVFTQPGLRSRFWSCVVQAHYIQNYVATNTLVKTPVELMKLVSSVIRVSKEKAVQLMGCPVRYEPFVVHMVGPSNIGKSFISQSLIIDILRQMGVTSYDQPIFIRTPGNEYWNGCSSQPAVLYDDWMAVKGDKFGKVQVAELFALKTSAVFNPPMAAVTEKELRYNPYLVWLSGNSAFPALNSVTCPEAVYRRRDILIHTELKKEFRSIKDVSKEVLDVYGHLNFAIYNDSTKDVRGPLMSYGDLKEALLARAMKYHTQEKINVSARINLLQELLPAGSARLGEGVDPFSIFYEMQTAAAQRGPIQTGLLPSQVVTEIIMGPLAETSHPATRVLDVLVEAQSRDNPRIDPPILLGNTDPSPSTTQTLSFSPDEMITQTAHNYARIFKVGENLGPVRGLTGCISYPIIKVGSWLGKQMMNKDAQLITKLCRGMIAECPICAENVICNFFCSESNLHAICSACYAGIVNAGDARCPMCRSGQMEVGHNVTNEITLYEKARLGITWLASYMMARPLECIGFLERNQVICDALLMISSCLVRGFCEYREASDLSRAASEVVRNYNNLHGTDYVVVQQGFNVYVTSANGYYQRLSADDEQSVRPPVYVPTKFVLPSTPTLDDCQHERVRETWEYFHPHPDSGVHGVWSPSDDPADENIPDGICGPLCVWPNRRPGFILNWAELHRGPIRLVQQEVKDFGKPHYPTYVPPDFIAQPLTRLNKLNLCISSWLTSLWSNPWWTYVSQKIKKYASILKIAGIVVGSIVAFTGIFSLFGKSPTAALSGYSVGGVKVPKTTVNTQGVKVLSLSGSSEWVMHVMKAYKNVCFVSTPQSQARNSFTRCLAIRERWILMTKHEYQKWMEKEEKGESVQLFQIRAPTLAWRTFRLADCSVNELEGYELVSICLPRSSVSHFPSIVQFIPESRNLSALRTDADIITCEYAEGACIARQLSVLITGVEDTILSKDAAGNVATYCGVYSYEGYSDPGGCGSILFSKDNNKPIIGFHFSGMTERVCSTGSAVPLWSEMLESMCPSEYVSDAHYTAIVAEEGTQKLSGPHEFVGIIDRKKVPFQSSRSKIKPSVISERLTILGELPQTIPVALTPRDPRWVAAGIVETPLVSGCEKHCKPVKDFPLENMEIVAESLKSDILFNARPLLVDTRKRTMTEAVCGLVDVAEFPPIKMDTSTGWSWNVDYPKLDRVGLLRPVRNEHDQMISIDPLPIFTDFCESRTLEREAGVRPATVFWDHLKDERKLKVKAIKPGGTRIFSLSPLDFLVQYRQLNLDYDAAWHANWLALEHAVGIAPDGPQWGVLARKLLAKGTKLVCLDFSNFGPGLNSLVAAKVESMNQDWYLKYQKQGDIKKDNQSRKMMVEEICNSTHLMSDYLYRTVCGIPSGHPGTTPLNTKTNQFYIKLAWLELAPIGKRSLSEFKKNCALFTYGDDMIMSVSDMAIEFFNLQTLIGFFAKYGIIATSASKQEETRSYMGIEECTFLKRGFQPHPTRRGEWLAPVDTVSVRDCAHWIHSSPSDIVATQLNMEQSVRLAYGHGPCEFEKWQQTVNSAASHNRGLVPVDLNWKLLDQEFFQKL